MPRKKKIQFDNGREKKDPAKRIVKKYAYYDKDGKRRTTTFTAYSEAEMAAKITEWNNDSLKRKKRPVTVSEAVEAYINSKCGTLSPSTIRSYEGMQKNHFATINDLSIYDLTKPIVQAWVSELVFSGLSAKTVKNCYGLLVPAIAMQDEDIRLSASLPQVKVFENYCPSDDDIAALLEKIQNKGDGELLRAVLLAAFGPMRRSEICALTSADIQGNTVYVTKAKVKAPDGSWVVKSPKTKDSHRKISMPSFVTDLCKGIEGELVPHTPDYIGNKFRAILKETDIPYFRFHDLRHYGASIMMYMGISQKTIESRGGWSTNSPVLKRIYQNKIESEMQRENEKINEHFASFGTKL